MVTMVPRDKFNSLARVDSLHDMFTGRWRVGRKSRERRGSGPW